MASAGLPAVDADALLREYRRPALSEMSGRFPQGGGRQLGGGDQADKHTKNVSEIDMALEWMVQRTAQVDLLAEAPSTAAPRTARKLAANVRPACPSVDVESAVVSELAELENSFRQVSSDLRREHAHVAALRKALEDASVDASAVDCTPAPSTRPAAILIRPPAGSGGRDGRGSSSSSTTAMDLKAAASRRATQLRSQMPAAQAELAAASHARATLEALASAAGLQIVMESSPASSSSARPAVMLAQLERLDRALRAKICGGGAEVWDANGGGGGGGGGGGDGRQFDARGGGRVHTLSDGEAATIPVTVFADGFMLYRGPFRPFGSEEATLFMQQVMAGMVPHELHQRHPDGCVFELHNSTAQTHSQAQADAHARSNASVAHVVGLGDVAGGAALLAPQRAHDVLRRLPQAVVHGDGNVVPIRSEVAQLMGLHAAGAAAPSNHEAGHQPQGEGQGQGHASKELRAARLRHFEGRR